MKRFFPAFAVFLLLSLAAWDVYARAGGAGVMSLSGGAGGGNGGNSLFSYYFVNLTFRLILAAIAYLILCVLSVYLWYANTRIRRKQQKVSGILAEMAKIEPEWSEKNLSALAREKFILLQTVWSDQNLPLLQQHLCTELFAEWEKKINEQIAREEKNIVQDVVIYSSKIIDAKNYLDDNQDEFTVVFEASAIDCKVWRNARVTKTNSSKFREFWTFKHTDNLWLLKEIVQQKGWRRFVNATLVFERMQKQP